jgi:hypothetical protein
LSTRSRLVLQRCSMSVGIPESVSTMESWMGALKLNGVIMAEDINCQVSTILPLNWGFSGGVMLVTMPVEYSLLCDRPEHLSQCRLCKARPFRSFLRGQVHRRKYRWWFFGEWPYSAVICSDCKNIVGYELTESERFDFSWGFGHSITFAPRMTHYRS